MTPGIYPGLSNEAYHASAGVSKSGLWTLYTKTAAHYKFGTKLQTKPQRLGELAHAAVLEPHRIGKHYVAGPRINKNKTEWKDAVSEMAKLGKIVCDADEYDAALRLADRLHADPVIKAILSAKPQIEASAYAIDSQTGELVRCRPDVAIPGLIGDLKTINDASGDRVTRAVQDYGYFLQDVVYREVWAGAGGGDCAFLLIFVEPTVPFEYKLIELDGEFRDIGKTIYRRALETYAESKRRDVWTGYAHTVETISPMSWYSKQFSMSGVPEE